MIEVQVEITIQRPADEIFEYVGDLTNDPKWHIDVIDAQPSSNGQNDDEKRYHLVLMYPRDESPQNAEATVHGVKETRTLRINADAGPLRQVMNYTFVPVEPGSTRVVRNLRLEHDMMPPGMETEMKPNIESRNLMYLQRLKAAMESCGCMPIAGTAGESGCMCGGR